MFMTSTNTLYSPLSLSFFLSPPLCLPVCPEQANNVYDFNWQKQLRMYWDDDAMGGLGTVSLSLSPPLSVCPELTYSDDDCAMGG